MLITEHELEKRAVAPRVTMEQVNNSIAKEFFFTAADGVRGATKHAHKMQGASENMELLTFCVLVMKNGFTVTGQSACADAKNFQKDIGQRIAREDAISKIWELLGYELKTKLTEASFRNERLQARGL